jgi:hypothetical protein
VTSPNPRQAPGTIVPPIDGTARRPLDALRELRIAQLAEDLSYSPNVARHRAPSGQVLVPDYPPPSRRRAVVPVAHGSSTPSSDTAQTRSDTTEPHLAGNLSSSTDSTQTRAQARSNRINSPDMFLTYRSGRVAQGRAGEEEKSWRSNALKNTGGSSLRKNRMPPGDYIPKDGRKGLKPTNTASVTRAPSPEVVRSAPPSPATSSPTKSSDDSLDTPTTSIVPDATPPATSDFRVIAITTGNPPADITVAPRTRPRPSEVLAARNPDQALTTRGLRVAARLRSETPSPDPPSVGNDFHDAFPHFRNFVHGVPEATVTQANERSALFRSLAQDIITSFENTPQDDGASRVIRRLQAEQVRALAEAMNRGASELIPVEVEIRVDVEGETLPPWRRVEGPSLIESTPSRRVIRGDQIPGATPRRGSALDSPDSASRMSRERRAAINNHLDDFLDRYDTREARDAEEAAARRGTTTLPEPIGLSRWRIEQLRAAGAARQRVSHLRDSAGRQATPGSESAPLLSTVDAADEFSNTPEIITLRQNVREAMAIAAEMERALTMARNELDEVMGRRDEASNRRREVTRGQAGAPRIVHASGPTGSVGDTPDTAEVRRRRRQRRGDEGVVDLVETLRLAELEDSLPVRENVGDRVAADVPLVAVVMEEVEDGWTSSPSGSETEREDVEGVTGGAVLEGSGEANPASPDNRATGKYTDTPTALSDSCSSRTSNLTLYFRCSSSRNSPRRPFMDSASDLKNPCEAIRQYV